jgi:hypothetical protein
MIDSQPKPENVQQYLFAGIFCYMMPTGIFLNKSHIISMMKIRAYGSKALQK